MLKGAGARALIVDLAERAPAGFAGQVIALDAAIEAGARAGSLGLPNHIDTGLQKVNHQRSLVDGFQETRTQVIVDIIEGAQNHMGDLRVQQILA